MLLGSHRAVWLAAHVAAVNEVWPSTKSAVVSEERGLSYSSTRLLLVSATYSRMPETLVSSASWYGAHSEFSERPPRLQVVVVKLPVCPNTASAVMSVFSTSA